MKNVVRMILLLLLLSVAVVHARIAEELQPLPPLVPHGLLRPLAASKPKASASLHVTIHGSAGSTDHAATLEPITFDRDGSGKYAPGEVNAAENSQAGDSGSVSAPPTSVWDGFASLDDVLDFFANTTDVPASPSQEAAAENAMAVNASTTGSSVDDIVVPTKTAESIVDQDPAAADKQVFPTPPTTTPTPRSSPPKPESAFQSAAMISKFCDAFFFAVMLMLLALH